MRRITLNSPSRLDNLQLVECEIPQPRAHEVLVRVHATSLNFHDYLVVSGVRPAPAGRVPMSDAVGTIVAVGSDVTDFSAGDRVISTYFADWVDGPPNNDNVMRMRGDHFDGFASEYVAMPAFCFTKAPSNLSDLEAATLPCAGLTAWRALFIEGRAKPGDCILIEGTGGVSIFALQFARMAGATVIALTSSDEKAERLRAMGAAYVVNYRSTPEWGLAVRDLTGGGVDHLLEVVGGDLTQSVRACRTGGMIHLIGALSQKPVQFRAVTAITSNLRIGGLTVGSRRDQMDMVKAIEANGLKPPVDRVFSFTDLQAAFEHQASGSHFGKICASW